MTYLGVQAVPAAELTTRFKKRLNIEVDRGLVVLEVVPDSPAAKAGLRHGDVITRINGKDVTELGELRQAVSRASPGQEVTLEVMRGEEKKEVKARLEEPPVRLNEAVPAAGFGDLVPGDLPLTLNEDRRRIERLEERIDRLEKRLRELEQKQKPETSK